VGDVRRVLGALGRVSGVGGVGGKGVSEKFSIILADPAWKYNSRAHHQTRFRGGACGHYDLMSTEEICRIPVGTWAEDNAILFLWACFPMLADAMRVIARWGFTYKTNGFTWIKTNPVSGTPFFGVGYYTKSNAEPCLLAARGEVELGPWGVRMDEEAEPCLLATRGEVLKPAVNTVSQVIIASRAEHSAKPEEAQDRIDRMYPDARKLELFARRERPGWTAWGHDTGWHLAPDGVHRMERPPEPVAPLVPVATSAPVLVAQGALFE
jgi:N6-adenosine-specific RNA methylase IME4